MTSPTFHNKPKPSGWKTQNIFLVARAWRKQPPPFFEILPQIPQIHSGVNILMTYIFIYTDLMEFCPILEHLKTALAQICFESTLSKWWWYKPLLLFRSGNLSWAKYIISAENVVLLKTLYHLHNEKKIKRTVYMEKML